MKRITPAVAAALMFLVLGGPLPARAQRGNSLEPGAWAMQFGVGGRFVSVWSLNGGISLKRHLSPGSAVRGGISASLADSDSESASSTNTSDRSSLGVSILFQRYVNPGAEANFYWGVGPEAFYYRSESAGESSLNRSISIERTEWSAGVSARLGIEWFASRVISFHAEYVAGLSYRSLTQTVQTSDLGVVDRQERTTDSWGFGGGGTVLFGMSLYF